MMDKITVGEFFTYCEETVMNLNTQDRQRFWDYTLDGFIVKIDPTQEIEISTNEEAA